MSIIKWILLIWAIMISLFVIYIAVVAIFGSPRETDESYYDEQEEYIRKWMEAKKK